MYYFPFPSVWSFAYFILIFIFIILLFYYFTFILLFIYFVQQIAQPTQTAFFNTQMPAVLNVPSLPSLLDTLTQKQHKQGVAGNRREKDQCYKEDA